MDTTQKFEAPVQPFRISRPDFLYSVAIFFAAAMILYHGSQNPMIYNPDVDWPLLAFFLCFSLFTIVVGFPHPTFGHVSFDRVAQVSAILILGPFGAALVSGLASFVYPWHRLAKGVPLGGVLTAALHNCGLMTLLAFTCGYFYIFLGGEIPLRTLDGSALMRLIVLALVMQMLNDAGMLTLSQIRGGKSTWTFNLFATGVELSATAVAVLMTIVFLRLEFTAFILLLAILAVAFLAMKKFAEMRFRLETLVDKRTEQLQLKSAELERQATRDKLTGLYNRRFADDYLQKRIVRAHEDGVPFAIAIADIDFFKKINDEYSHLVGDEVLCRVSALFQSRCRRSDMISRYGGEEFLICFPETELQEVREICEELCVAIETADWSAIEPGLRVTLSVGLAGLSSGSNSMNLMTVADSNLYKAKADGRNRVIG